VITRDSTVRILTKRSFISHMITSALDGGGWSTPSPDHFTPGKGRGAHCIRGSLSPRVGLDGCGKARLPPGFDLRTVQPVESRYIDCAIPVHPKETVTSVI
jgi:hypothetical protein